MSEKLLQLTKFGDAGPDGQAGQHRDKKGEIPQVGHEIFGLARDGGREAGISVTRPLPTTSRTRAETEAGGL
jgi:hypothetical protein